MAVKKNKRYYSVFVSKVLAAIKSASKHGIGLSKHALSWMKFLNCNNWGNILKCFITLMIEQIIGKLPDI